MITVLRRHGDGLEVGGGRVLPRHELGVDVAVQLAVEVVVALVLERAAARRALEAFHVQVLVLYAYKHAAVGRQRNTFSDGHDVLYPILNGLFK